MPEERWRWWDETTCREVGDRVPWMSSRWTSYLIGNYPRWVKGEQGEVARASYMNALYVLRNSSPVPAALRWLSPAEAGFHRAINCVVRTLEAEQRGEVEVLEGLRKRR